MLKLTRKPTLAAFAVLLLTAGYSAIAAEKSAEEAAINPGTWQGSSGKFSYKVTPDAKVSTPAPDQLQLLAGDALVEASKHTTILTPLTQTRISKKAVVYFKVRKGVEHIFVLCDNSSDSVNVVSHQHKISLTAGQEVAVSETFPKYQHLTADDVGRRRILAHPIGDNQFMVTSEFALMHTFETLPLMQQVSHSSDGHDHSVKEAIIKTAVVLDAVQRAHGSYYRGGRD